ncbi:MAG TPA: hypothetical protein DEP84_05295 [Chloroflexi bacterium]|nr:hypothetical protein [Chloroflexota bacterium]
MHAAQEDVPIVFQHGDGETRLVDWGEMTVAFQRLPAGLESASLFAELPGGQCPSAHWGYVFKGRMRFRGRDGEEIIEAGQAYYIPPGHTAEFLEDTEVLEFSPRAEFRMTMQIATRKLGGKL